MDMITDRGFRHPPAVEGVPGYGGSARVYESSAASAAHVWIAVIDGRSGVESIVHLTLEDAQRFADSITRVCDLHYQHRL